MRAGGEMEESGVFTGTVLDGGVALLQLLIHRRYLQNDALTVSVEGKDVQLCLVFTKVNVDAQLIVKLSGNLMARLYSH